MSLTAVSSVPLPLFVHAAVLEGDYGVAGCATAHCMGYIA